MFASVSGLGAQSVVFVSPSTTGFVSLPCAAGSLGSFEELHFLAATHALTEQLCPQARIEGVAGLWHGQAENSGLIDGCPIEQARAVGALLGRYYHQKAALVFARASAGKDGLVTFRVKAGIAVIAQRMSEVQISGASVLAHAEGSTVLMVVTNDAERTRARKLYSLLRGFEWREEPGTAELIGDADRSRARQAYDRLIENSPAAVKGLEAEMYTEKFEDLGLEGP